MNKGDDYPVDQNIPMPAPGGPGRSPRNYYPWKTMELGASFLFPKFPNPSSPYVNVHQANRTYFPKQFMVRRTEEGFRVWRIR